MVGLILILAVLKEGFNLALYIADGLGLFLKMRGR